MKIRRYDDVQIVNEEREPEAVKIAVRNLKRDFRRVLDCNMQPADGAPRHRIVVGTIGISEEIGQKARTDLLRDQDGTLYKEAFLIQEKDGELLIAGSDRRGTVYGVYEVCGVWLGVSPWYFFADVPVRQKEEVCFAEGLIKADHPSVEYRGIFINDEEELEHWVQRYMGEDTIGVKTYEKIFELLLRLKLNYIWPAMHVNSFNLKRENGALADRMGIVVGTSHCDMLMRSNNREWKPWLAKKGYTDVEYDFSIPGRNREILKEYWRESVEQNKEFEVSYTLGMRGIHDSGFSVKALAGKEGEELLTAKKELLASVIEAQREILSEVLPGETLKTFVPYKEVLELYDNGLEVPEDMTLIWVNDNYGYVRRYPSQKEKERRGGNGIYYHNSYWAPPGGSYLFICSIPLAHTRNELLKAYEEGIRKIWVTNFGAIKPLEQQLSFYAALAWDAGKENALTDREEAFLEKWIDGMFSGGYGKELAGYLTAFDQLTNARKVEQMDADAFSQTAYGDEAVTRIHRYERMFEAVNRIWKELPEQEQDAFFQMIAMKIHAGYFTNLMYYYADRSVLCMRQGKYGAAREYTDRSKAIDRARRSMLYYYNHVMANGKWNGILTPEDFPPPRTAMHPACMMPTGAEAGMAAGAAAVKATGAEKDAGIAARDRSEEYDKEPVVTLWNEEPEIVFTKQAVKWIEIANQSDTAWTGCMRGPDWIRFTDSGACAVEINVRPGGEERILFEADWEKLFRDMSGSDVPPKQYGYLEIEDADTRVFRKIPVSAICWRRDAGDFAGSGTFEGARGFVGAEGYAGVEGFVGAEGYAGVGGFVGARGYAVTGDFADEKIFVGVEDDGRVCVEAVSGEHDGGWKEIENLGRDSSGLLEARSAGAEVTYPVRIFSAGNFLLETHRFPSLDSVGEIRVGISVDGGKVQTVKSDSNDEYRGTWKENVRNNVDKICLELPFMEAGEHIIRLHADSKYFAFTRFVIYTKERKENALGKEGGCQRLPEEFDAENFARHYYGEEALLLSPRPVLYLPPSASGDSLAMEDKVVQLSCYGEPVAPEEIVESGRVLTEERDGVLRIEAASALVQSEYAYTVNGSWQWCNSPSHGETGLAMYIRKMDRACENAQEAPALCYRMHVLGGRYRIWIRMLMWGDDTSHFALAIDGNRIPEKELCGGHSTWRYSNEQVWKWIPVFETSLAEGDHVLQVSALSPMLRFEQIYMTTGEEYPPAEESV